MVGVVVPVGGGARRTNSKAGSSHSTAGNSDTDNIHNSPVRTQSRSRLERRNVAPQQSSSPPPPVQLTEVSSLFYLLVIKQEAPAKVSRFYPCATTSGYAIMQTLCPIRSYETWRSRSAFAEFAAPRPGNAITGPP